MSESVTVSQHPESRLRIGFSLEGRQSRTFVGFNAQAGCSLVSSENLKGDNVAEQGKIRAALAAPQ